MNPLKYVNYNSSENIIYKCMTCGHVIENPKGPFGKRFCSDECRKKYFS